MLKKLDKLKVNEVALIKKIELKDQVRRRLLDLGLIDDTKIKVLFKSPLGDPTAYLIRGSVIALRKKDTSLISVETIGKEA